ncbi:unknown [Bacteroides sp. CAG:144]|nr:unknown [Bacteroides sp. CAG:144]
MFIAFLHNYTEATYMLQQQKKDVNALAINNSLSPRLALLALTQ